MKRFRREILEVSSIGITAGIAGCSTLQSSSSQPNTTSSGSGNTTQELRDRITELEATVEEKNERIEELEQGNSSFESQPNTTSSESDNTTQELRDRITELEATVEEKNERIEELERADSTTTPNQEFSDDVFEQAETMAREARNGIVTVRGDSGSSGTGWILDSDQGHIVTNSHVVADSESFSIETFEGATETATRIGYHEDLQPDVALLKTNLNELQELPIGDESTLSKDDPLVTIGHPGNAGNWIMSIGRHESYERDFEWLLSTVPTSSGNSGGPLLTVDGDVVGVVSGTTTMQNGPDENSKSDELYAELPSSPELTTSSPTSTLIESIDEWT